MKEELRDLLMEQAEEDSVQDWKEDDGDHPDYEQWFRETYCSQ